MFKSLGLWQVLSKYRQPGLGMVVICTTSVWLSWRAQVPQHNGSIVADCDLFAVLTWSPHFTAGSLSCDSWSRRTLWSVTKHMASFRTCADWSRHVCPSFYAQAAGVALYPLCSHPHPCDQDTWHFTQIDKWELVLKKQKVMMLEMKFQLNINGVVEAISECGNMDTVAAWENVDMHPEDRVRWASRHKWGEQLWQKEEDIPEEVTVAKNWR